MPDMEEKDTFYSATKRTVARKRKELAKSEVQDIDLYTQAMSPLIREKTEGAAKEMANLMQDNNKMKTGEIG